MLTQQDPRLRAERLLKDQPAPANGYWVNDFTWETVLERLRTAKPLED